MSAWVDQIFQAQAANGGVVRRSRADVDKQASLTEVITEAVAKGFHVIETGDQVVVLCHPGQLVVHC
jgi:hypothetical protein